MGTLSRTIKRREFLQYAAGGLAAATAQSASSPTDTPRRPNVIYVFSDEHRWHSMSFTEMPALHTPNMRQLAGQGVSFTNCISNYPVCSPYRAMLLTGRWPYQQGVIDNGIALSANETTLAKAFQSAGYATGYIGKWHLGGVRAEPFGFDLSLVWTDDNTHWDQSEYHPREGAPVKPKGYNATLMTDQALAFIDEHRARPFLLLLSLNPPHSNFLDAPPEKKALYPEGSLPVRKNADPHALAAEGSSAPIWKQNGWSVYQGYHAHVSAIDDELGRIMKKLDDLDLADDTILVYSSDHGSMLGSHGVGGKRQPYEESIRVPFLARWPGAIPKGATSNALFGAIDIMPTLCGIAGVSVPAACVGADLAPTLRGRPGPEPEAQFLMHISKKNASGGEQHPAPLFRGVRTSRYTYAVRPEKPWCLFDNQEDPFQMTNRIGDPAMKPVCEHLAEMLQEFLKKANDPFTLPT